MRSPHPFTLRQLQYVVAVADLRSFRAAAEECNVSQPSLSAQVAQVEEAAGLRLFERNRRGVAVSPAGGPFIERARALLLAADELRDLAARSRDPFAGTFRLGIIPTAGPYLLPRLAPLLRKRWPEATFVWSEEKTARLMDDLARGGIDAAIVALDGTPSTLPHVVLGKDRFVFAAPPAHPLAKKTTPIRAEELEGERVLLLDDGHCFRDQALAVCNRNGAEESAWRATSLGTLVQMAASGGGVTILPELAVGVENRQHALRIRPFAPREPMRTMALVWRREAALADALRAIGGVIQAAWRN